MTSSIITSAFLKSVVEKAYLSMMIKPFNLKVYYDAIKSETEGGQGEQSNPGEWPWSVLIFRFPLKLEES